MKSLDEVENITLAEYLIRMKAYRLQQVDKTFEIATQAWFNNQVKATDKDGRSIYRNFKDFFDFEQVENSVLKPEKLEKDMDSDLVKRARRLQEYRKMKSQERR